MKTGQIYVKSQEFDLNHDFEKTLLRGSAWNNLYIPYKYQASEGIFQTEQEKIMHLIQVYNFVSLELRLFLFTHKSCIKSLQELEKVNKELEKLIYYYESKFGALTACSTINTKDYISNPWPWEGKR